MIDDKAFSIAEEVVSNLQNYNEEDRKMFSKSLSWYSRGLSLSEPVVRFLCLMISIESLAWYIEREKKRFDYPFVKIQYDKRTKEERLLDFDTCIENLLQTQMIEQKSRKFIDKAYVNCLKGIESTVRNHLTNLFSNNYEIIKPLFEKDGQSKSFYQLRHDIAHGSFDVSKESNKDRLMFDVWKLEQIANKYLQLVLKKTNPLIN